MEGTTQIIDQARSYAISKDGRVYSRETWNEVKTRHAGQYGTLAVSIKVGGRYISRYVHRLVAETFLDKPDYETMVVEHIDGNRSNNHVSNLRWTDRWKIKHNPKSGYKLTSEQILEIKRLLEKGVSQVKVAAKYKVTQSTISRIKQKRTYKKVR